MLLENYFPVLLFILFDIEVIFLMPSLEWE